MFDVDGDRVVRAVLTFEDDLLVVESNSEERQERVLDTLAGRLDPTVVSDDMLDGPSFDPFAEPADPTESGHGWLGTDEIPEEVLLAVEEQVRSHERRWVDEPIPALEGLTPREALDDPTRREDLFALLREMRQQGSPGDPGSMSAERIEDLLGL